MLLDMVEIEEQEIKVKTSVRNLTV